MYSVLINTCTAITHPRTRCRKCPASHTTPRDISIPESVFWIRTWFGHKDDKVSQDAADTAYQRLRLVALQDNDLCPEVDYFSVFEDKDELSPRGWNPVDAGAHFVDGAARATPWSVPSSLVTAMTHCPDYLHVWGMRRSPQISAAEEEEMDRNPCGKELLVLVADRVACEQGWGQVLPFRMRGREEDVMYCEGHWADGFSEEDEEDYICGQSDSC